MLFLDHTDNNASGKVNNIFELCDLAILTTKMTDALAKILFGKCFLIN